MVIKGTQICFGLGKLEHIKHTRKYTHRHRFMCKKIYKFSFKQFWTKRNCYKEIVQPIIKIDTDKKETKMEPSHVCESCHVIVRVFSNLFPPQKNLGHNLRFLHGDVSFAGSWAWVRLVITGRCPRFCLASTLDDLSPVHIARNAIAAGLFGGSLFIRVFS